MAGEAMQGCVSESRPVGRGRSSNLRPTISEHLGIVIWLGSVFMDCASVSFSFFRGMSWLCLPSRLYVGGIRFHLVSCTSAPLLPTAALLFFFLCYVSVLYFTLRPPNKSLIPAVRRVHLSSQGLFQECLQRDINLIDNSIPTISGVRSTKTACQSCSAVGTQAL